MLWRQRLAKSRSEHLSNIWTTPSSMCLACNEMMIHTLQGTVTYPTWGKGKSSSKMPFLGYVSSLEGMAWFCISFWSFVSCFGAQTLLSCGEKAAGWWFTSVRGCSRVGWRCMPVRLPHWNLHVVSSKIFCCFRLSLTTMTNITMVCCPTSSPKYKESPPDVCIGLHKWRVAQHGLHHIWEEATLTHFIVANSLTRHCAMAICVAADAPILLAYQWPVHLFFPIVGAQLQLLTVLKALVGYIGMVFLNLWKGHEKPCQRGHKEFMVGGFNPFEKY